MHPEPGRAARAARWCAAVATGLVVSCLIFGPSLGSMGLIGAQAAHTGREAPLRNRVRMLLVVGLATLAMECVGALVGPRTWLIPPLFGLLTLVIVWTWHALLTGPPGPINTIFAAAFSAYMTGHGYAPHDAAEGHRPVVAHRLADLGGHPVVRSLGAGARGGRRGR